MKMESITISELKNSLNIWSKQNKDKESLSENEIYNLYAKLALYKYIGGKEDTLKILDRILPEKINYEEKQKILTKQIEYLIVGVFQLIKINANDKKDFVNNCEKIIGLKFNIRDNLDYEKFTDNIITRYIACRNLHEAYNKEYLNIIIQYSDEYI